MVIAPPPQKKLQKKSVDYIGALAAICLVTSFFSFYYLQNQIAQELSFLALSIPALMLIKSGKANFRSSLLLFRWSLLYLIPSTLSLIGCVLDPDGMDFYDIMVLINLCIAFFLASIFASSSDDLMCQKIMKYTTLLGLPLFVHTALTESDAYFWGRWEPYGIQPNWWGMMALSWLWGALLFNSVFIRISAILAAFFFMVALQSRGSIASLFVVTVFSSGLFFPISKKRVFTYGIILPATAIFLLCLFLDTGIHFVESINHFIYEKVLLINDPLRGMGTGLTGRASAYETAWSVFLESPVIGAGFSRFDFVHNGFLLTLAESGLLGLIGMLVLISRSLRNIIKQKNWTLLGIHLSYLVAIMSYPRSFNINMTGFLFLIVLMLGFSPFRQITKGCKSE